MAFYQQLIQAERDAHAETPTDNSPWQQIKHAETNETYYFNFKTITHIDATPTSSRRPAKNVLRSREPSLLSTTNNKRPSVNASRSSSISSYHTSSSKQHNGHEKDEVLHFTAYWSDDNGKSKVHLSYDINQNVYTVRIDGDANIYNNAEITTRAGHIATLHDLHIKQTVNIQNRPAQLAACDTSTRLYLEQHARQLMYQLHELEKKLRIGKTHLALDGTPLIEVDGAIVLKEITRLKKILSSRPV